MASRSSRVGVVAIVTKHDIGAMKPLRYPSDGDRGSCSGSPRKGDADDEIVDLELITVENFDEETLRKPVLTSPRSIEACRMLGLEPEELVKRSREYFAAHAGPGEEPGLIVKRAARYEKNRQIQLRNVRAQRDELIDAELHGVHGGMSLRTRSFCHSPLSAKLSIGKHSESLYHSKDQREFGVIEREKKELERMRLRQAQEMQQLLTFEMRMAEIHREQELKEQEHRRQQEMLTREKLRRQREADEQRRRKELERAKQMRQETERVRQEAQERQREIMLKTEQDEREKERRRREQKLTDKERIRKQEEQRLQNELQQLQQQREAEQKALEIERREERRRQLLEHKKRQKAGVMAEKQQKNKMRITSVLQDRDLMRQLQLEEQQRKQHESVERRQRFEEDRRRREEEVRSQAAKKKEDIELVQQQLQQIEQERRERLMEQERQVQARLQAQEREKQQLREEQKREEKWQEEERRRVYLRMEEQLKQRQRSTVTKAEQKSAVAKMVHEQKRQMVRSRLQEAKLREEEIEAALTRKQKQDNYRVNLLMSRIESDNERARIIKEQREQLVRRRQQIKMTATRQKQELLESFHRMKITKKYELPKHLQQSLDVVRPQSASALQTRSLTRDTSADQLHGAPLPPNQHSLQRPPMAKRPASASACSSARTTTWRTGNPRSARARTSRSASGYDDDNLDDNDLGVQNDDSDGGSNCNTGRSLSTFEADIDEVRRKQNEELLHVLQQEHHAEEQREYLLQHVSNSAERSRMEQIFNKERAQASDRIMRLTQQHEQALTSRMQDL